MDSITFRYLDFNKLFDSISMLICPQVMVGTTSVDICSKNLSMSSRKSIFIFEGVFYMHITVDGNPDKSRSTNTFSLKGLG